MNLPANDLTRGVIPIAIVFSLLAGAIGLTWFVSNQFGALNNQFIELRLFISETVATRTQVEALDQRLREVENRINRYHPE